MSTDDEGNAVYIYRDPTPKNGHDMDAHKLVGSVKSILKTNHSAPRCVRMRLCCLKTWSHVRLAWTFAILLCMSAIFATTVGSIKYVEREWTHGLMPGWCTSQNCTTTDDRCTCLVLFVASRAPSPGSNETRTLRWFNTTTKGACPFTDVDGDHDGSLLVQGDGGGHRYSYQCWMNPVWQMWTRMPNLWILILMSGLTCLAVAVLAQCIMCAATSDVDISLYLKADPELADWINTDKWVHGLGSATGQ